MVLAQYQMPGQIGFQTVNFYDLSSQCLELLCCFRVKAEGSLTELCKQTS